MAKRRRRNGGQRADYAFDCPAKGYVEFPVWLRKGETLAEAGRRGLREVVRLDEPQIPL